MKTFLRKDTIKFSTTIIALIVALTSCSSLGEVQEIRQINYGTSFGECVGYCKRDLNMEKGTLTYKCSGWADTIKTITHTKSLPDSVWNSLRAALNINEFLKLQKVIGCPDCADGGAEWLEIELNTGTRHKVTFEYNREPQTLKLCMPALRRLQADNNCDL
jgi:hypothetical protein